MMKDLNEFQDYILKRSKFITESNNKNELFWKGEAGRAAGFIQYIQEELFDYDIVDVPFGIYNAIIEAVKILKQYNKTHPDKYKYLLEHAEWILDEMQVIEPQAI